MRIPSGTTDQYVYFVAVDDTDGVTRETGLSSFSVYRSRNGAAAAAMTTPTINETDSSNMPGVYELLLDEDMTIGSGNDSEAMVFHITHAGMRPVTIEIELYRPKLTVGETLTISSGVLPWNAAWDAEVQSEATDALNAYDPPTRAELTSDINGLNDLDAAGIRAAVGLASANLDTQLSALAGYIDTEVAAILEDTGTTIPGLLSSLATASALATVDTNVSSILTDTGTTLPAQISGLNDPTAAAIADAVLDEALSGHTTAGSLGKAIADIESDVTAVLADTNELQQDDYPTTLTAIAADVTSILADTGTDIPAAIAALNDPTAAAIADAVWDEAQADHTTADTFGALASELAALNDLSSGDIETAVDTALGAFSGVLDANVVQWKGFTALDPVSGRPRVSVDLITTDAVDADALAADAVAEIKSAVAEALTDIHLDHLLAATYDPASKPGTADALLNELIESDAGVSRFTANSLEQAPTGGSAPTAAAIADAVWDEAQADHVSAGSFGVMASELADVLVDTATTIPGLIAALNDLSAAEVNAEVDTALANYDAPTKAELDAGFSALNDISVSDILTTQMTESYAADGTAPTLTQAVMLIQQALTEFAISGTTITVKEIDKTTPAATYTLDDSATPTSRTRGS